MVEVLPAPFGPSRATTSPGVGREGHAVHGHHVAVGDPQVVDLDGRGIASRGDATDCRRGRPRAEWPGFGGWAAVPSLR